MSPAPNALAVGSETVVVGERSRRLVALEPRSGEVRWDVAVDAARSTVAISRRSCLHLSARRLTCLDLASGTIRWQVPEEGWPGYQCVSDGVVLIGGWRGYSPLHARNLATGELLWTRDGGSRPSLTWPHPCAEGVLVAEKGERTLALLDASTGKTRRTWSLPAQVRSGDLEFAFTQSDDGRLLLGVGMSQIVELAQDGFELVWDHDGTLDANPPLLHLGKIWMTDGSGLVVADTGDSDFVRVHLPEGPALGITRTSQGVVVADRSGIVLHVAADGSITTRPLGSRRAISVAPGSTPDTSFVLAKGELIALEFRPRSADDPADVEAARLNDFGQQIATELAELATDRVQWGDYLSEAETSAVADGIDPISPCGDVRR